MHNEIKDNQSENIDSNSSPPKPPLCFRVAFAGHRPNRLKYADIEVLRQVIRNILETVEAKVREVWQSHHEVYASSPPALRAISSLAEGADRLFAEEAMTLGWDMCCVMPFPREEYERDFSSEHALETDSLERFYRIIDEGKARNRLTILELDGAPSDRGMAYETAGRVLLGLSDLLVAVWDGKKERDQQGGTAITIAKAQRAGTPVVLVDAQAPHAWRLLGAADHDETAVRKAVGSLLSLPDAPAHETTHVERHTQGSAIELLRMYYAETRPRWNVAVIWKIFRNVVGELRFTVPSLKSSPFGEPVTDEWQHDESTPAAVLTHRLRPFYAWPDKLAKLYADLYRSGFILSYLLAALAVAMALLPVALGLTKWNGLCNMLELASIALVLLLFYLARSRHWHERWLDYRLAAELVRSLQIMAPICGKSLLPPVPAHHVMHGLPEATWMNWHVRAVNRAMGLTNAKLDRGYLLGHLHHLRTYLNGQLNFHRSGMRCGNAIESRLHFAMSASLGLTILACVLHLIHTPIPGGLLTFFCGTFPAVGGALAAINNQGEFRRIAKRSQAMQSGIGRIITRIDALNSKMSAPDNAGTSFLSAVSDVAEDASDLLVREVLDWRVLILDRPPEVGA